MATQSGGRGVYKGPDAVISQNEIRDLRRRLAQAAATTVVSSTSFGQSSAVGTLQTFSREDHVHGTPSAAAVRSAVFGQALIIANFGLGI